MISLISKWKLRCGANEDLLKALREAVCGVQANEPDTLMYLVHLTGRSPMGAGSTPIDPPPGPIALAQQTEVVFLETYRDAEAFSRHVNGEVFQTFLKNNLHHFYEDPTLSGWPVTETEFLVREGGFIRLEANP